LTGGLSRVFNESAPIRYRDLRRDAANDAVVDLTIRRVTSTRSAEPFALVTFDEERKVPAEMLVAPEGDLASERIASLEIDLRAARENLQSTIEALETSNEELQATNEELMASNEELQTTNEELHSVNQELYTVNTELQKKLGELTQLTTDMDLLLASTEIHTLFLDRDLGVRRYTPNIAKVFKLVGTDVGRPIDAFHYTLDRPGLYDEVRRVIAGGAPVEAQVRDGGTWYLLRVLPYRRESAIDGAVLTLVDITGMKRLEAEARSKHELLTNILVNSPHPVFIRDREGRYVVADEAFRRLASRDPSGLKPEQIFSVDVAAMLTRHDARIVGEGVTVESEETIPTPVGPRTFLTVRFPMRGADGAILGVGGIQTDVTSLKRAESEARASAERRDRFLATLSHELRNPLAAVLNAARVVTRGALDGGELERWHRIILERSLHMTRLVDDLLDVARLTQDKLVLERTAIDLVAVAKGVVEEVAGFFHEREVELRTEFDADLELIADATRLHQLQVNLLTNAVRHTPPGGTTTFRVHADGPVAEVAVRDTGEGIPADMLEKIFDLFVQADGPGARGTERGLGVGLALVRRIADLHGGDVSVTSGGKGLGSEFRVRIPIERPAPRAAAAPAPQAAAPATVRTPRSVLLVDDDDSTRKGMSKLLELDGVVVRAVASGAEALVSIERDPIPDVVLLDIGLPEVDGYEVCRRLRASPNGATVLVFALTGFGQDSDREAARRAGFDGHLTKPI
ncbi:MAG TPA: PAS domain-containing protein, partial [Minicystis sp.]|nr:PAS domain-containing protein [Minicystis sp.]